MKMVPTVHSSITFLNKSISPNDLASDVLSQVEQDPQTSHPLISLPKDIYKSIRHNSKSVVLSEQDEVDRLYKQQQRWLEHKWHAKSIIDKADIEGQDLEPVFNPADNSDEVGAVIYATNKQIDQCLERAKSAFLENNQNQNTVCQSLNRAADLYEANRAELMVLAMREAGKTYQDAVDEVREAVDFLRYYAKLGQKGDARAARSAWCFCLYKSLEFSAGNFFWPDSSRTFCW